MTEDPNRAPLATDEHVVLTGGPRAVDAGDTLYAATYDALEVEWPDEHQTYLEWAKAAASGRTPMVLELACGTGRVAIPLADAGCTVWAVDYSDAMLTLARAKRGSGNPTWCHGDMRTLELDVRADLAIIPAQSFQFMLTAQDQLRCLDSVRRHLGPDGRIAIHVELHGRDFLAGLPESAPPDGKRLVRGPLLDADGVPWHMQLGLWLDRLGEKVVYECDWVRLDGTTILERRRQVPMALKVLGVVEMQHVLARAGFEVVEMREWFGGHATSLDARQLVWLAKPAGER